MDEFMRISCWQSALRFHGLARLRGLIHSPSEAVDGGFLDTGNDRGRRVPIIRIQQGRAVAAGRFARRVSEFILQGCRGSSSGEASALTISNNV